MKVLIVDSSAAIILRYKEILSIVSGIELIYDATNYKDAIKHISSFKPEIMLLDTNLPGGQSIELVKEIRLAQGNVKIIAIANNMDEMLIEQFNESGVDHFIDKYNDFEKIPGIIQSFAI